MNKFKRTDLNILADSFNEEYTKITRPCFRDAMSLRGLAYLFKNKKVKAVWVDEGDATNDYYIITNFEYIELSVTHENRMGFQWMAYPLVATYNMLHLYAPEAAALLLMDESDKPLDSRAWFLSHIDDEMLQWTSDKESQVFNMYREIRAIYTEPEFYLS